MSFSLAALLGLGSLLPTVAEAKSKDRDHRDYHYDRYEHHESSSRHFSKNHRHTRLARVWVPGHSVRHHGHRHWVPGHYELRRVYYWR